MVGDGAAGSSEAGAVKAGGIKASSSNGSTIMRSTSLFSASVGGGSGGVAFGSSRVAVSGGRPKSSSCCSSGSACLNGCAPAARRHGCDGRCCGAATTGSATDSSEDELSIARTLTARFATRELAAASFTPGTMRQAARAPRLASRVIRMAAIMCLALGVGPCDGLSDGRKCSASACSSASWNWHWSSPGTLCNAWPCRAARAAMAGYPAAPLRWKAAGLAAGPA